MKRILVVDDERHVTDGISSIVKRFLKDEFDVCGSAQSGREAIVKATALAPDIVLVDQPGELQDVLAGYPVVTEVPRGRGAVAGLSGAQGLRLAAARARLCRG